MALHGVGSLYSPIVISDDEDEAAYVEFALEQRISSPTEDMDYDNSEDNYQHRNTARDSPKPEQNRFASGDHNASGDHLSAVPPNGAPAEPPSGYKRKRSSSLREPSRAAGHPQARPSGKTLVPAVESKQARKKRRKRERLAAEAAEVEQVAGPSALSLPPMSLPPLPLPPPLPALPRSTHQLPRHKLNDSRPASGLASLPPRPIDVAFPPPAPSGPAPLSAVGRQPAFDDLSNPKSPFTSSRLTISAASWPQSLPQSARITSPVLRIPGPACVPSQTTTTSPIASAASPVVMTAPILASKKPIGMPPDADPNSQHGVYIVPPSMCYVPNPARSLVMELLPKKFRNVAFIRSWAMSFGSRPPVQPRIELDTKVGKALIEFSSAEVARAAWESNRLHGEGREHIRLYWYRVPGVGADAGVGELEEGEIEDGELTKHVATKPKQKQKEQKKKPKEAPGSLPAAAPSSTPFMAYASPLLHPLSFNHAVASSSQHGKFGVNIVETAGSSTSSQMAGYTSETLDRSSALSISRSRQSFSHTLPQIEPSPTYGVSHRSLIEPDHAPSPPAINNRWPSPRLAGPWSSAWTPATSLDNKTMADAAYPSLVSLPIEESMDLGSEDGQLLHDPQSADDASIASSRGISPFSQPVGAVSESETNNGQATGPVERLQTLVLSAAIPPSDLAEDTTSSLPVFQPLPLSREKSIILPGNQNPPMSQLPKSTTSNSLSLPDDRPVEAIGFLSSTSPIPLPESGVHATTIRGSNSVKAALLARQRELEVTIARTKEMMATRGSISRSNTGTPNAEVEALLSEPASVVIPSVPVPASSLDQTTAIIAESTSEDMATSMKEDNLRRMVLSSKRSRIEADAHAGPSHSSFVSEKNVEEGGGDQTAVPQPARPWRGDRTIKTATRSTVERSQRVAKDASHSSAAPMVRSAEVSMTGDLCTMKTTTMEMTTLDLDNLAVSFITETIQTVSAPSKSPDLPLSLSSSSPPSPVRMSEKEILSAKQKLLEQKIMESKEFMKQYQGAATKGQKIQIMQRMDARLRVLDVEMKVLEDAVAFKPPSVVRRRWPEPELTAMVIDISDEEDGDE